MAGTPIRSKLLFEALDAHGHDLALESITCPTCRAAIAVEGFCETCRIGWVRRQAYFSRLTYHIARGKPVDPSRIECRRCRTNAGKYGWCETCSVGMVGNVAIGDRSAFEDACRGYELMLAANEASRRCESCALAILTDTRCFACRTWYKDGRPVRREGS